MFTFCQSYDMMCAKNRKDIKMVKQKIVELPNPHVPRKPIVDACLGGKEYETLEKNKKVTKVTADCDKILDGVCIAYADPAVMQRHGCPLASNKIRTVEHIQKLNPIKNSKRRNR